MTWTKVAEVTSDSTPGKTYEIKQHPTTNAYGCTCMSYRFSKGEKTCRHLRAWHGIQHFAPSITQPVSQTRVDTTGRETFTFRALNLDD